MSSTTAAFRPLTLGQIIDQAITIYRRNFLVFIGIIAVIQIPLSLFQFVTNALPSSLMLDPQSTSPTLMYGSLGVVCFGLLITTLATLILVQGFGFGAIARAVVDYRLGRTTGILDAYRGLRPQAAHLAVTMLFGSMLLFAIGLWLMVPCIGWLTGMGMLLFAAAVMVPMLASIVMLEGKTGLVALRRAWDLARRRFGWVLGFSFVVTLLGQIIVVGPTLLMSYGMISTASWINDPVAASLVNNAIQIFATTIGTILYMPINAAAFTLMYLDLRVRTEGLDLVMQAAPPGQELTITGLLAAPAEASEKLITTNEWVYFFGITIGAGVLYSILSIVLFGVMWAFLAVAGLD